MDNYSEEKVRVERRKYPRLDVSVDVEYVVVGRDSCGKETSTKNISAGGICLIVYESIEVNTVLALKINLPDGRPPLQAKGKVVWRSEFTISSDGLTRYDLGIEFIEIGEDARKQLSQYVFASLR